LEGRPDAGQFHCQGLLHGQAAVNTRSIARAPQAGWRRDLLSGNERLRSALNHLRWISALVVVISHARGFSFIAKPDLHASPAIGAFYFFSRFGGEAVMVFFVLSGLLIGGKFIDARYRDPGKFGDYLIDRFSRLTTVLIPAVLFAVLAFHLAPAAIIGPEACDMSPSTILGNLAYLQGIFVHPLCNDQPLWSLSNEFWYYLIFPASIFVFVARGAARYVSLIGIAVFLAVVAAYNPWDDRSILIYFPVWLSGLLVWRSERIGEFPLPVSLVFLVAAAIFARAPVLENIFWLKDYLLAIGVVLVARSLARPSADHTIRNRRLERFGHAMADFSFSLYLIHFPIIMLANAMLAKAGIAYPLDPHWAPSYAIFVGLILVSLMGAYLLYWISERHTARIRQALRAMVHSLHAAPVAES
jgi:peptidoglycan/LPS O-acetylase OafA/YrhL